MTNPGTRATQAGWRLCALQEKMNLPISQLFVHCNIQPAPPLAHLKCLLRYVGRIRRLGAERNGRHGILWPVWLGIGLRPDAVRKALPDPPYHQQVECSFYIMFYQVPPSRPSQMHHIFPAARHRCLWCGPNSIYMYGLIPSRVHLFCNIHGYLLLALKGSTYQKAC